VIRRRLLCLGLLVAMGWAKNGGKYISAGRTRFRLQLRLSGGELLLHDKKKMFDPFSTPSSYGNRWRLSAGASMFGAGALTFPAVRLHRRILILHAL
jgi:hypothetical protein